MSKKLKTLYNPESLTSFSEIIENDINMQAVEFQFEAGKHNWPMPYGDFLDEMFRCLDEYVENNNIEPIQDLSSKAINGWQDDTIINKYKAFSNLQLAYKFMKANNIYKAMQYYKRGITYKYLKSTADLENDIITSRYKSIGKKGGSKKGENYKEAREKALDYHDKFFSKKDSNGRFIYSGDKASEKIIEHFNKLREPLGYEVRPLARHINAHRKEHFNN